MGDETPAIPDKLVFRIGEVSQIVGVEPYVVRYWETEFPSLAPKKSSSGQRIFRRKEVELLLRIKHLLYDKKYTIEGARKALQEKAPARLPDGKQTELFPTSAVPEIRKELVAIIKMLE